MYEKPLEMGRLINFKYFVLTAVLGITLVEM